MRVDSIKLNEKITEKQIFTALLDKGWSPVNPAGLWVKRAAERDGWYILVVKGRTVSRYRWE